MILLLLDWLQDSWACLEIFRPQSMRAVLALMTAFLLVWSLGPCLINWLSRMKVAQSIRNDGPEAHLKKSGTPTMGGLLIIFAVVVGSLCWCQWAAPQVWISLLVMVSFGAIGWSDDYLKIKHSSSRGLPGLHKYFWLSFFAIVALLLIHKSTVVHQTILTIPYLSGWVMDLGLLHYLLGYFVLVGTSNAVNLTDGLDGLAIVPALLIAIGFIIFATIIGHALYADYLLFTFIPESGELVVLLAAFVGAGMGFLWFNSYPAQVFMGDVGSLGIGGLLGIIAVLIQQELLLFIMGGLFVLETISVMIQVVYFKRTGKRVFKMAPFHHHFELSGWSEPKVIVRFWIVALLFVLLGLASLLVR